MRACHWQVSLGHLRRTAQKTVGYVALGLMRLDLAGEGKSGYGQTSPSPDKEYKHPEYLPTHCVKGPLTS